MRKYIVACAILAIAVAGSVVATPHHGEDVRTFPVTPEAENYWSRWRGPSGQGLVKGTNYVDRWSSTQNVVWRTAVPGLGHSSPIVWKDHLFITTAQQGGSKMSMLAYDRRSGKQLWETAVPSSGVEHIYPKNSHASATAVTDGQQIYASFGTHGLAAFDFNGKLVWHRKVGDLANPHGSAGSPVLYKDRIFIYQDHRGTSNLGSFVAAFSTKTGETMWWKDRVEVVGWGTPVVITTGARDELIVSSQRKVYAYTRIPVPSCGRSPAICMKSFRRRSSGTGLSLPSPAARVPRSRFVLAAPATSQRHMWRGRRRRARPLCPQACCTATCCIRSTTCRAS